MKSGQIRKIALITALCTLLIPFVAFGQQAYDIQMGTAPGFAYSYIHDANSTAGMAPFYPSGTKWFDIDGALAFSLSGDGNTLTVNASTLTAAGRSGTPYAGESWTLSISGGTLDKSVNVDDGVNSLMGTLGYNFTNNGSDIGGSNTLTDHMGTFYFYNMSAFVTPNTFDSSSLYLWANNWDNMTESKPSSNAIGLDLGSTNVVPEPVSSTLFLVGAAALGFRRFRNKKSGV